MTAATSEERRRSAEINRIFARAMQVLSQVSLAAVVVTFGLYLSGTLSPYLPPHRLALLLGQGAADAGAQQAMPGGWRWLALLNHSDMLSLGGLVLLVLSVIGAYVTLVPLLLRQRSWLYLVLVLLQLAVFALAGTGWLSGGH